MINKKLNINKTFRVKVQKCMNNIFGPSTQSFIKATLAENNTRVLALLLFYKTRDNPKKDFKLLSCVI